MTEHRPRYQFDCKRCKFNWCCGPKCACNLSKIPLRETPKRRVLTVAKERREGGHAPAAVELVKDWEKSNLRLVAEIMKS